jgi:NADH:ubiquinone oxidoreductase subunit 5 (subunit L)/multisubunit Na+/H+ antiporter MnhA subunit
MGELLNFINDILLSGFLQNLIGIPILAGILLFLVPEKFKLLKGLISLTISLVSFVMAIVLFTSGNQIIHFSDQVSSVDRLMPGYGIWADASRYFSFNIDGLSRVVILFTGLFAFLINLYSLSYMTANKKIKNYYEYFLITLGAAFGALLSDNLLLFLFFWGILGITLYRLIRGCDEESSAAAKKSLILIGASDGIMIIGIGILWMLTGKLGMSAISVETNSILSVVAFLALLTGSFTKAGAFPFHTWVPDYTKEAPATSSAYLPASLDKLLGIYFLARITNQLFILSDPLVFILMTIGVVTILTAVMMALVQHNYKKLLGYHAVSQVGYMVLGFGLGSAIGVAAGLFHMINHALYKSGLLLTAGCVEFRTKRENIDELGGLSGAMPITFATALIFALSISGIPPLNGFASKWMIYQGIVESGAHPTLAGRLWFVWLGLAVLGSALTLASFIKFIGGIFLSGRKKEFGSVREVPAVMWIPLVVLALFCLFFGFFTSSVVVPVLLTPASGDFTFTGTWNSSFILIMVLVSIVLGGIIYLSGRIRGFRSEENFIGGEKPTDETAFPVTGFYNTIGEFKPIAWLYRKASDGWFDLYELSRQGVLWLSHQLSVVHTGVLPYYAFWVICGLVLMLIFVVY